MPWESDSQPIGLGRPAICDARSASTSWCATRAAQLELGPEVRRHSCLGCEPLCSSDDLLRYIQTLQATNQTRYRGSKVTIAAPVVSHSVRLCPDGAMLGQVSRLTKLWVRGDDGAASVREWLATRAQPRQDNIFCALQLGIQSNEELLMIILQNHAQILLFGIRPHVGVQPAALRLFRQLSGQKVIRNDHGAKTAPAEAEIEAATAAPPAGSTEIM